jgi:hypothetical protein
MHAQKGCFEGLVDRPRNGAVKISRTVSGLMMYPVSARKQKAHRHGRTSFNLGHMEREKRLELSTYTLARYRSTN